MFSYSVLRISVRGAANLMEAWVVYPTAAT
jgi:hypothetical protein